MQNTKNKPLLTISFLSCGRAKTIGKCLESIKPIMDAIPCELIVVDTGCGEEIRSLIEKYTNHIVNFVWCNDFSKARNAGLREASGEWFIYLDDDEWFEDTSAIVSFFTSGEYKNYACACYIQRNYFEWDAKKWNDIWVSRMIRLDADTHFESSIHEYLFPVRSEYKLLDSYVHHFGYVYDSEEERLAHAKRNIVPLKDMLQKEPNQIRWWIQLVQEYNEIKDYEEQSKLSLDGLKQFAARDSRDVNGYRGTFHIALVKNCLTKGEYEQAEIYFKEAIADRRTTNMCRAALYCKIAEMYHVTGQVEKCTECCEEYMRLYDILKDDKNAQFLQGSFFTYDALDYNIRNNIYCFYTRCCVINGNSDAFVTTFYKLDWQQELLHIYHTYMDDVLEGFVMLPYRKEFSEMAQVMLNRKAVDQLVIEKLRKIEKEEPVKYDILERVFGKNIAKQTIASDVFNMAQQLKVNLKILLDKKMYKESYVIMEQVKKLVPLDDEMLAMEEEINKNLASV